MIDLLVLASSKTKVCSSDLALLHILIPSTYINRIKGLSEVYIAKESVLTMQVVHYVVQ